MSYLMLWVFYKIEIRKNTTYIFNVLLCLDFTD